MPATLSPKGSELLDFLPPFVAEAEAIRSTVDTMGREVQRIEDKANAVRWSFFPQLADDTFGILGMLETLHGLPVKPVGASLTQRRARVLAHIHKRHSGKGTDWEESMVTALAGDTWWYEEGPAEYEVTIHLPYSPGSYSVGTILALVERITPAHLLIAVQYSEGFIIGESQLGIGRL